MAEESWKAMGRWTPLIDFSNVPVHASLLPNGKVLYWGRRANPKSTDPGDPKSTHLKSLNDKDNEFTNAFLWDPLTGTSQPTLNDPVGADGKRVNLFCSGHCFLPDGTLLVVGGHIIDGFGLTQACIYDPGTNRFTAKTLMNAGRWYPSALTLPDGRALVISGSIDNFDNSWNHPNTLSQIWPSGISNPNTWIEVKDSATEKVMLNLYPRVHLSPKGHIFMAGPQAKSYWLKVKDDKDNDIKSDPNQQVIGKWEDAKTERKGQFRDYAPSVMYDTGKLMYIGGGLSDSETPTNMTEFIDLNGDNPKWDPPDKTKDMRIPRRQFNATVLPDGTVLVTGGTQGPGFNNIRGENPVHQAELWDPVAKKWTDMAKESADRCYHSIALLLPDGRVLSAGGGEWGGPPAPTFQNAPPPGPVTPADCLTNGQLFEPPYLFKGARPTIVSAPSEISYGAKFSITLGTSDPIAKISWVRLGSVTHCRNMNQSLMFLKDFTQTGSNISVPAPADSKLAPPGHYMLFVLNKNGVPSTAPIIRISKAPDKTIQRSARVADVAQPARSVQPTLLEHDERIAAEQDRPPVVVGITPSCPYGLGPCWGGAYDALQRVSDIEVVRPVPHQADSVAFVYVKQDVFPDIDVWRREFEEVANRSYDIRGIEMTVSGVVNKKLSDGKEQMVLAGTSTRPQLILAPFQEPSQLKYDLTANAPRPISDAEAGAYRELSAALAEYQAGVTVQVTGTLQKHGADEFSLDIREFKVLDSTAS